MTSRRGRSQWSLLALSILSMGVALFLATVYVLLQGIGWVGTLVYFFLASPFWFFLFYGFNGAVRGLRGGKDSYGSNRYLPEKLPADIDPPPATGSKKRKARRERGARPAGWWHPFDVYGKH